MLKLLLNPPITSAISRDLSQPVFSICLWDARAPVASMTVPKAAVHENGELAPNINYVRISGNIASMQSVTRRN
jgi:hypothetical protein